MNIIRRLIRKLRNLSLTDEEYARKLGVIIGENCWISTRNFPSEPYLITIGNYVRIAPKVQFFSHDAIWTIRNKYSDKSFDYFGRITVGDYTCIGTGSLIMAGVHIGSNVIIGAGSIVTKSIPDNCMVAGNPAKYIGNTDDFYKRMKKKDVKTSGLSYTEKKKILLSLDDESFVWKNRSMLLHQTS